MPEKRKSASIPAPIQAKNINIVGAREHNLKDISIVLPRDKMIVITGLSGSGKSSLAFDTIYAEGQRRYVESLSAYGGPKLRSSRNIWSPPIQNTFPTNSLPSLKLPRVI